MSACGTTFEACVPHVSLSGVKQTSRKGALTSASDPKLTCCVTPLTRSVTAGRVVPTRSSYVQAKLTGEP
jgi:hypothetical protein